MECDTWSGGLVGTLGTSIIFVLATYGSVSTGWECLGTINFEQLLNIVSLVFKIQCDVLIQSVSWNCKAAKLVHPILDLAPNTNNEV